MNEITYDLIITFAVGLFLFLVVGVQLYFGKVYTKGGRGTKWHKKSIVSREEAPNIFWIIIGLQSLIGFALVLISGIEILNRLY